MRLNTLWKNTKNEINIDINNFSGLRELSSALRDVALNFCPFRIQQKFNSYANLLANGL